MKVIVKKYGRWDEDCNWRLEAVEFKNMPDEIYGSREEMEFIGYKYSDLYDEYYLISANHLAMVVVRKENDDDAARWKDCFII